MFNVCIFQHDVIQIHMNYQGGDIGCGFCKYDITTADIDNLKYTYMITSLKIRNIILKMASILIK